jgi:transposase
VPGPVSHRDARDLKGARFALWKNPEDLTDRQQAKLSSIQKTNARLYRAYLLKERLRQIYRLPAEHAIKLLDEWIAWAKRCRMRRSSSSPGRSPLSVRASSRS